MFYSFIFNLGKEESCLNLIIAATIAKCWLLEPNKSPVSLSWWSVELLKTILAALNLEGFRRDSGGSSLILRQQSHLHRTPRAAIGITSVACCQDVMNFSSSDKFELASPLVPPQCSLSGSIWVCKSKEL